MSNNKEYNLYISVNGSDKNKGTIDQPILTLKKAQEIIRELDRKNNYKIIKVLLRQGKYRLDQSITFTTEDSAGEQQKIVYCSYPGEEVIISGTKEIQGQWELYKDGIYKCSIKHIEKIDQLFINNEPRILARYPNYDYDNPLMAGKGYIDPIGGSDKRPDEYLIFDPDTFTKKKWSDPTTGVIHAFQSHFWGNMQYKIKSIDYANNKVNLGEGGFQLQRRFGINHRSRFFVENIFEELDTAGEYYYDEKKAELYYMPFENEDIHKAIVEVAVLERLFEFKGCENYPVKNISLEGMMLTGTKRTFMNEYESLSRGDWSVHRGGALFFDGAVDCGVKDCNFHELGGNAVFVNNFNRNIRIDGNNFESIGESAVCFVGDHKAVRNYATFLLGDNEVALRAKEDIDTIAGPKTSNYPSDCTVHNNKICNIGVYGKQTAGVMVSKSMDITISHNTIYNVPRAAICINDGTWGGHIIEYNDIWETVRETGEHGPFNAWGRDRQWNHAVEGGLEKEFALLDAQKQIIIRNNRVANYRKSISAGNWTIDLDDGSTNYHIYNNLNLGSTIKLREGYYRKVENNICVSSVAVGFHVWPEESEDTFERNIIVVAGTKPGDTEACNHLIAPTRMPKDHWGKRIDHNTYYNYNTNHFLVKSRVPSRDFSIEEWRASGYDQNGLFADPLFIDPANNNFNIREDSPAIKTGFKPFDMTSFGHMQTRIIPFGGEFTSNQVVSMSPHVEGGEVFYTLDGSSVSTSAHKYINPINIEKTTIIRAQTFFNGIKVGFEERVRFTKVDNIEYPDWQKVVIEGYKDDSDTTSEGSNDKTSAYNYKGALLQNIFDGDLIDSLGGHDTGVVVSEIESNSKAFKKGLRSSDVIIKVNGAAIKDMKDFKRHTNVLSEKEEIFTIMRGYDRIDLSD